MTTMRELEPHELDAVFGGDSWGGTPEGREPVDDYWGQACDALGFVAGVLLARVASTATANTIGESVRVWCNNGFVTPSTPVTTPPSPFGGGGATGSWGDPGSLKDAANRRLA